MELQNWITFISAAFIINITPGPDLFFILSRSSRAGKLSALWGGVGLWVASFTHVIAVAIGLSAIIFASPVAFTVIKYIGAIYLIWMGLKVFLSTPGGSPKKNEKEGYIKAFYAGFFVNISNPKAALFFMAFLPMFIQSDDVSPQFHLMILGVVVILVKIVVEILFIFLSTYIVQAFENNKRLEKLVNKISSLFFIAFGIQLFILPKS